MNVKNFAIVAGLSVILLGSVQVQANDVFAKNCVACHSGGGNIMNPAKGLSKANLDANGVNSVDKIKALVSNGKSPMPAFGKMLSAEDIASVSAYVMEQAAAGWK